jgi:hypothetical protein
MTNFAQLQPEVILAYLYDGGFSGFYVGKTW